MSLFIYILLIVKCIYIWVSEWVKFIIVVEKLKFVRSVVMNIFLILWEGFKCELKCLNLDGEV